MMFLQSQSCVDCHNVLISLINVKLGNIIPFDFHSVKELSLFINEVKGKRG
jgi:hypothetical protein